MARLVEHRFRAMGTACGVSATAPAAAVQSARFAIAAAVAEVAACERALSRFDPASELSALNRGAGRWISVGPRLFQAVQVAVQARLATGGRFDPSVLPALVAAGYDRSFDELRPRNAGTLAGWRAGAAIELDPAGRRVLLEAGSAIDLGGVGKGLAATRALRAMRLAWPRLPGGLVDMGGDLAVWGVSPDGDWRIAVADPRTAESRLGVLRLCAGGVATSGRDRRRFGPGKRFHHLIDPATGRPAVPGPLAVTVVASTAAEAEAHATALAITPAGLAEDYLAARPGLAAVVVPASGPPIVLGDLPIELSPPPAPVGAAA
jgi:FAD:protein FMN transferase